MNDKLKVLDLFSGIGGFSLGLERTGGFETVAFCEIDPECRAELRRLWPGVPIYEDVTTMDFSEITADVVTGGFPCQDISVAGMGAGLDGVQSGLWSEIVRALGVVRPKYAIFENSERLISGDSGRWLAAVLWNLAALRLDAEWHCISASYIGAPHERDRVFIIASDPSQAVRQRRFGLLFGWGQPCPSEITPDSANNDGIWQLEPQRGIAHIRRWALHCAERYWTETWDVKLAALRDMDDGISDRIYRAAALKFGNTVLPQFPEMLGRSILKAEGLA